MQVSEFLAQEIIKNKSQTKLGMVITGGGSLAISELLKHGGAADVFHFAIVPYHPDFLEEILRYKPEKSVTAKVAYDLCVGSVNKDKEEGNVLLVSCTASLRKAGSEREGRIHEAYLGFNNGNGSDVYHVVFNANRTREQEEELLAMIILAGIDQYVNLRKMSILHSIAHTANSQKEQMGYSHLDWSDKDIIDIVYMRGHSLEIQDKTDSN